MLWHLQPWACPHFLMLPCFCSICYFLCLFYFFSCHIYSCPYSFTPAHYPYSITVTLETFPSDLPPAPYMPTLPEWIVPLSKLSPDALCTIHHWALSTTTSWPNKSASSLKYKLYVRNGVLFNMVWTGSSTVPITSHTQPTFLHEWILPLINTFLCL